MSSLSTDKPPPEQCWRGPNAANKPKRFKQEYQADDQNEEQDQGNLTIQDLQYFLKTL